MSDLTPTDDPIELEPPAAKPAGSKDSMGKNTTDSHVAGHGEEN